jgi:hypothetical protein
LVLKTSPKRFVSLQPNKNKIMLIERTDKEIIIRLPASTNIEDLQNMVDYARYKEVTSKSKASQEDIDKLIKEVKKGSWKKLRKKLIK